MSEAYIVVGPPRSGTSLAAGLLCALGVDFGGNYKGGRFNPVYYEDLALANFFLNGEGTPKEIVERLQRSSKWGMKFPRLCLYWSLFEGLVTKPHFIVTLRSLESIVASRKHSSCPQLSLSQIREDTEKHYRGMKALQGPKLCVWFENWFTSEEQLNRLAAFVGLPVTEKAQKLPRKVLVHYE
jgi:hypothetical protein